MKVQIDIIDNQLERFKHLIKGYRSEEPSRNGDRNEDSRNEDSRNEEKSEEDFPGLNTETPDLFDTGSEKRKLRHRIRKSLNKFE